MHQHRRNERGRSSNCRTCAWAPGHIPSTRLYILIPTLTISQPHGRRRRPKNMRLAQAHSLLSERQGLRRKSRRSNRPPDHRAPFGRGLLPFFSRSAALGRVALALRGLPPSLLVAAVAAGASTAVESADDALASTGTSGLRLRSPRCPRRLRRKFFGGRFHRRIRHPATSQKTPTVCAI